MKKQCFMRPRRATTKAPENARDTRAFSGKETPVAHSGLKADPATSPRRSQSVKIGRPASVSLPQTHNVGAPQKMIARANAFARSW